MRGEGELKKLKKDLKKNREEIADLQRRIRALLFKHSSSTEGKKAPRKSPPKD